jgi:hypothetical protein
MGTDREQDLLQWQAQVRERSADSRRLMARAHAHSQAQRRVARAVKGRAHQQVDRAANDWPALHGLASRTQGHADEDVVGFVLATVSSQFGGGVSVSLTVVDQFGEDPQRCRTAGATGGARAADEVQYRLGEGPCLEAVELDMAAVVRADDLGDRDARRSWPRLCPVLGDLGVRSAMSISVPWSPLRIGVQADRRSLGAVNVYAREPYAFATTELAATLLGCWAGAIMSGREPAEILRMGD